MRLLMRRGLQVQRGRAWTLRLLSLGLRSSPRGAATSWVCFFTADGSFSMSCGVCCSSTAAGSKVGTAASACLVASSTPSASGAFAPFSASRRMDIWLGFCSAAACGVLGSEPFGSSPSTFGAAPVGLACSSGVNGKAVMGRAVSVPGAAGLALCPSAPGIRTTSRHKPNYVPPCPIPEPEPGRAIEPRSAGTAGDVGRAAEPVAILRVRKGLDQFGATTGQARTREHPVNRRQAGQRHARPAEVGIDLDFDKMRRKCVAYFTGRQSGVGAGRGRQQRGRPAGRKRCRASAPLPRR